MIEDATLQWPEARQLRKRAALVGGIALLVCVVGGVANPEHFFRSYLFAYVYWAGIAIGSLAIVLLHHLSGGGWGIMIRRLLEAATRTLPLVAALFLPVVLGMKPLYEWARPEVVEADKILQFKAPYLNVPFFLSADCSSISRAGSRWPTFLTAGRASRTKPETQRWRGRWKR